MSPQKTPTKQGASAVVSADAAPTPVPETMPASNAEPATPVESQEEAMEFATGCSAAKRTREETTGEEPTTGTTGSGEPPSKTSVLRRSSIRPRPNALTERKSTTEQPP
ncbi:hypothetical protein MTO96_037082 [Rhipicephalus appendiculatus]